MTDKLTPGHQEDAKKIIEFVGSVKPIEVMTDKNRKLAEEILNNSLSDYYLAEINQHDFDGSQPFKIMFLEAMQEYAEAYHSAKMQEVTDEDIIEWACYGYNESVGMDEITEGRIQGAKAMRNGEIKHKEG